MNLTDVIVLFGLAALASAAICALDTLVSGVRRDNTKKADDVDPGLDEPTTIVG